MQVQDVMSTDVVTVDQSDALWMAYDLMTVEHIRHLPVLEKNDLVGIVAQRDLFKACMSSILGIGKTDQPTFSHTLQVMDIMSPLIITVSPETPVREAADIIIQQQIGCLPVMAGSRMIGIITKTDLLRDPQTAAGNKKIQGGIPDRNLLELLVQYRHGDRLHVPEQWWSNLFK